MAQEGFIEVPGGRVWYRSVGDGGTPLAVIEDASHLCFAEQPEEFTGMVNGFLDRVDAG